MRCRRCLLPEVPEVVVVVVEAVVPEVAPMDEEPVNSGDVLSVDCSGEGGVKELVKPT